MKWDFYEPASVLPLGRREGKSMRRLASLKQMAGIYLKKKEKTTTKNVYIKTCIKDAMHATPNRTVSAC